MNAVVTGATKGMGKAIALKLVQAGYNLAICSRSQEELNELIQEINLNYPSVKIAGLKTDCAYPEQVRLFADFVQQHFSVTDVLVNNVGMFKPGNILDEDDHVLALQTQVNLNTAYSLSKVFGRQMREKKKGHIINICSIASIKPVVTAGSYSVTKFALLGLTRVLREELMPHKVKVTAIIPGSTLTSSWSGTDIPADHFIAADDIASAVMSSLEMSAGCNVDEIIMRPIGGEV